MELNCVHNSVPISQRNKYVTIIKYDQLMFLSELVGISDSHKKPEAKFKSN